MDILMGTNYYVCPSDLPHVGRHLAGAVSYEVAMLDLQPDEDMYMLLDNGVRQIAPLIDSQHEWNEFYTQYANGRYLSYALYAVKREGTWT
jgi:hypothetical protein